jgi:four helix bundle protein
MQDFRNLEVWAKAHALVLAVYQTTAAFPKEEQYGLTSQIRRAAVSIPANIAEGCGRATDPDFFRFLQIAMGSACELEYELLLSKDLGLVEIKSAQALEKQVQSVKQMLAALLRSVRTRSQTAKSIAEEMEAYEMNDSTQTADSGLRKADTGQRKAIF